MAYSIACKDAGSDCPATFITENKEELMEHVELHAKHSHPYMKIDAEEKEKLQAFVKTV